MFHDLFGAEKISLEMLYEIQKDAPNLILWAVPFMLFFTLLEIVISYYEGRHLYRRNETIGSVATGVGYLLSAALVKAFLFYLVILAYNLIPWRMELVWWTLAPCIVIFDLCSYWAHRISHEQRFWWATHIPHHSSETYNLSVTFRLSWIQHIKIIFFLPVVLLGFHPIIFFFANQISILFQFFVHTEYIRKLHPVIEFTFATPSNHRVHHGSQEKYINKNYGAIFILWDRLFGTYQKEEEQVIYGLTTNIEEKHKVNPFYITFHEVIDIARDVIQAKGFKRKFFLAFGDPEKIMIEKKRMQDELYESEK